MLSNRLFCKLLNPVAKQILRNPQPYHKFICHQTRKSSSCCKSGRESAACKTCIITGGSAGIGLACARSLLEAGAKGVVLGDVNVELGEQVCGELNKEFSESKPRVYFQKCDVTCKKDFEDLFELAREKFKYIDIVFNNAGILQFSNWEKEISINIYGMVLGTFLGFQYMGKHCGGYGGAIINCGSILGVQAFHASPVYSGTKHFINGFVRSVGHDYYECITGVKVYALCPGVTDTNMIEDSNKYSLKPFDDIGEILKKELLNLPRQPSSACGECLLKILDKGINGSIWIIENSECYQIKIPHRDDMRVCGE